VNFAQACAILNIAELHFLDYRDSGMVDTPENADPRNFHNADPEEATERVTRLIRQCRPQVVVTYNERGGYGHPDHIAAHRTTLAAIAAAAASGTLPSARTARLARRQTCITQPSRARRFGGLPRRCVSTALPHHSAGQSAILPTLQCPTSKSRPASTLAISSCRSARRCAVHRTQLGPDNFFLTMPDDIVRQFFGTETFTRVQSRVAAPAMEESLFAGLG